MRSVSKSGLPIVAVMYGTGSAGPVRILQAAQDLCEIVFVCDTANPGVLPLLGGLKRRSRVVDISGKNAIEAARHLTAEAVSGVVTFSDYCIMQVAAIAQQLRLPYHAVSTAALLTDKNAQRRAFRSQGVDNTPNYVAASAKCVLEAAAQIGCPVVIKPLQGAGSRNTYMLTNADELPRWLDELFVDAESNNSGPYVVEKYLEGDPQVAGDGLGDYVSVESAIFEQTILTLGVTGKLPLCAPFRESGMFVPSSLTPEMEREVVKLAEVAIRALGITTGITHTEIKLTLDGPRIIEVNGRAGGHVVDLLSRSGRVDLIRAALQIALGKTPEFSPFPAKGIFFEWFLIPRVDASEVTSIEGAVETRLIPGVEAVETGSPLPQKVDSRIGNQRLGSVHGKAPDMASFMSICQQVEKTLIANYSGNWPEVTPDHSAAVKPEHSG